MPCRQSGAASQASTPASSRSLVADEARLTEIMLECQQILTELDPPVIYLGQTEMYTALNPSIQGFVAYPLYLETYFPYSLSRV